MERINMTYPQQPMAQPQFGQQYPAQPQQQFGQPDPAWAQSQQGPVVPPPPGYPQDTGQADTSGFFGGGATVSFDAAKGYRLGTPRGGMVISKSISNQTDMATGKLKTWEDGSPRKQLTIVLQTAERADPHDDGKRQLFVKGGMVAAVKDAIRASGAPDVEVGGYLYVAWVDEDHSKKVGNNALKIYKAVYARPGQPDPMAGQPAYQASVPQPAVQQPQMAAQFASPVPAGQSFGQPVPQQFAPQAQPQPQQATAPQQAYQQPGQPTAAPQQFTQPGGQQPPNGVEAAQPGAAPVAASTPPWNPFGGQ